MQRGVNDGFDLSRADRRFAPAAVPQFEHRIDAVLPKPGAPGQHRRPAHVDGGGNPAVRDPVVRHQQRLRPNNDPMRCRRTPGPLFQEPSSLRGDRQSCCRITHPTIVTDDHYM